MRTVLNEGTPQTWECQRNMNVLKCFNDRQGKGKATGSLPSTGECAVGWQQDDEAILRKDGLVECLEKASKLNQLQKPPRA